MTPGLKLFPDATDPFREFLLSGTAQEKVLIIPVSGIISDLPQRRIFTTYPGMVQEIVSQLRLAQKDPDIRAVLLKIDSPGGSVTASDLLYHEILSFKQKTGAKVVAVLMNIAASGGYYIALSADRIVAHPTTITGSVGVIFFRPRVKGLLDMLGVEVDVDTSGRHKDMGSPFRPPDKEEERIFKEITKTLGDNFVQLVKKRRRLDDRAIEDISTARIYLAEGAKQVGLVDEIGYLDKAIQECKALAGISPDARVVVYRRLEFPDDNIYNTIQMRGQGPEPRLVDFGLSRFMPDLTPGFYYLWTPQQVR